MPNIIYRPCFDRFLDALVQRLDPIDVANAEHFRWGVDLGAGENARLLVVAALPEDRFHVLYEFVGDDDGLIGLLQRASEAPSPSPARVMMGLDGLNRNPVNGVSPVELVRQLGLQPSIIVNTLRRSLYRVRSLVSDVPGLSPLTVHPRCERLIADLASYAVRPKAGGGLEPVQHQYSHGLDAMRYALAATLGGTPHAAGH